MAKTAYVSNETLRALEVWHSGQWSAAYSVLSMGGGTPAKLREAADELDVDLEKAIQAGNVSAKDRDMAEDAIMELEFAADNPKEFYVANAGEVWSALAWVDGIEQMAELTRQALLKYHKDPRRHNPQLDNAEDSARRIRVLATTLVRKIGKIG